MDESPSAVEFAMGFAGALLGAALGYAVFGWLFRQGVYAMALPGALVGLGCGALSGRRSVVLGVVAAVVAAVLSAGIEWRWMPFAADDSLGYFVTHLHRLPPFKLVMMALGTAFAYWFGRGRERGAQRSTVRRREDDPC